MGLLGWTFKIHPLFGSDKILVQNSQTTSGHIWALTYSNLHSCSTNTFNRSFDQFRILWPSSLPFNNLNQVQNHRSGVYSLRYFHTTHSVNNYLQWIHSLFQMSRPSIAHCYEKIVEDPTLLHLFSLKEYSSMQELPCLGALQFRLISEGFFICIASPDKWGKTGVKFVTLTGLKKSGQTTNTVILITNGIGERYLGMVMVICHPEQARIKACDALSALCQLNPSELSVVVIRRYPNTPYIPRGTSCSLYLDVGPFLGGIASTQFPLDRLNLCQVLSFSESEVLLPHEVGRGVRDIPPSPIVPMG